MNETGYVLRDLEGNAAERTVTVRAYSEATGEVVVTIPTSDMDADALPDAIRHALSQKTAAEQAADHGELLTPAEDAKLPDDDDTAAVES